MNVKDLAVRAAHTFWQSFVAVIGVVWAASGLNFSQVTDPSSAKRFVLAALVAVGAAALSAAKTAVSSVLASVAANKAKGWSPGEAEKLLASLALKYSAATEVAPLVQGTLAPVIQEARNPNSTV